MEEDESKAVCGTVIDTPSLHRKFFLKKDKHQVSNFNSSEWVPSLILLFGCCYMYINGTSRLEMIKAL